MHLRGLTCLLVAAAFLGLADGALAAPLKPKAPDPIPPAHGIMGDSIADPIAQAIRTALAKAVKAGSDADRHDAAGVVEYYAETGYVPLWTANGTLTDRARGLIARLATADADGLDPQALHTPSPDLGKTARADLPAIADADVMLSMALVTYAHQAYAGRLVPGDVSPNIGYQQHVPDAAVTLGSLVLASDPVATLAAYNPPQKEFAALRDKLAELRRDAATATQVVIPAGGSLKPGMSDPRLPVIRQRLHLPAAATDEEVYDDATADAVKSFQRSLKLKADGVIGGGTLVALNKPEDNHIATVIANMERWRWMPRYLGNFYVRVNIPDFTVDIYKDGNVVHSTRIVVGQPDKQTPIFSNEIQYIVVNPSWNVPTSIVEKEYLPQLRGGGYPRGFDVFARVGGRFRAVDPSTVNWRTVSANDVQFRQPPGERNALGVIKFMFPNQYAVYLHDTPSKALFKNDYRAYSHGCMRVMDPWDFADSLLAQETWNADRLKKLVGGPETQVNLSKHVYVHITYFTAWVDDDGNLQIRNDVYGHDKTMEQELGLLGDKG